MFNISSHTSKDHSLCSKKRQLSPFLWRTLVIGDQCIIWPTSICSSGLGLLKSISLLLVLLRWRQFLLHQSLRTSTRSLYSCSCLLQIHATIAVSEFLHVAGFCAVLEVCSVECEEEWWQNWKNGGLLWDPCAAPHRPKDAVSQPENLTSFCQIVCWPGCHEKHLRQSKMSRLTVMTWCSPVCCCIVFKFICYGLELL